MFYELSKGEDMVDVGGLQATKLRCYFLRFVTQEAEIVDTLEWLFGFESLGLGGAS